MKEMFKKGITYFVLGCIVMLWFWSFFLKGSLPKYEVLEVVKTDTIYVNKPYKEIVIKEVVKPHEIHIYKVDTLIREKLIHDTLFLGLELKNNIAKVHTITPNGKPIIKQHTLPDFKSLKLNYEGDLDIKPKRKSKQKLWRNLERVGIAIGAFYLGSKLNQ